MVLNNYIDVLKALLSCVQADGSAVSHSFLEEKNEAKLKKICLSELQPGMLILATDEGRKINRTTVCMSPLFSADGDFDHNRACDAVLIRASVDGCELYYIEMKSDNPTGYVGQFQSTQCFMHYVFSLVQIFSGIDVKITRERFIIFHTDSRNSSVRGRKMKTRFSPKSANTANSPDKFIVKNEEQVRCTQIF